MSLVGYRKCPQLLRHGGEFNPARPRRETREQQSQVPNPPIFDPKKQDHQAHYDEGHGIGIAKRFGQGPCPASLFGLKQTPAEHRCEEDRGGLSRTSDGQVNCIARLMGFVQSVQGICAPQGDSVYSEDSIARQQACLLGRAVRVNALHHKRRQIVKAELDAGSPAFGEHPKCGVQNRRGGEHHRQCVQHGPRPSALGTRWGSFRHESAATNSTSLGASGFAACGTIPLLQSGPSTFLIAGTGNPDFLISVLNSLANRSISSGSSE